MFESIFIELSKENNCDYYKNDIKVNATLGSKMPITKHLLNIDYNESEIKMLYELGNYNLAEISFVIKKTRFKISDFQVDTRDRIIRFFTKKGIWKIKSNDQQLVSEITTILDASGLTELANCEAFDPMIKGEYKDDAFHFYMRYSLAFNNKEQSINPVLGFHKNMIDHINKRYV